MEAAVAEGGIVTCLRKRRTRDETVRGVCFLINLELHLAT